MIKETINYEDVDGNQRSKELYFHLSKTDFMKMVADGTYDRIKDMQTKGQEMSERAQKAKAEGRDVEATNDDYKFMLDVLDILISRSYGKRVKEDDGTVLFTKNEKQTNLFMESDLYGELIQQITESPDRLQKFIENIIPRSLLEQAADSVGRHSA